MPKAPAALSSPKIRKLAVKALNAPSMLSTEETRTLGAAVVAHLNPEAAAESKVPALRRKSVQPTPRKTPAKKAAAKKAARQKPFARTGQM